MAVVLRERKRALTKHVGEMQREDSCNIALDLKSVKKKVNLEFI